MVTKVFRNMICECVSRMSGEFSTHHHPINAMYLPSKKVEFVDVEYYCCCSGIKCNFCTKMAGYNFKYWFRLRKISSLVQTRLFTAPSSDKRR